MDQPHPDEPLLAALRTPTFAQPLEPRRDALTGPLGLRAGWGIVLFFLLTILLFLILFAGLFKSTGHMAEYRNLARQTAQASERAKATHQPAEPPPQRPSFTFLTESAETGAVLLAALGVSLLEKRRFAVYGLRPRYFLDLLPGAACGLLLIALLVAILRALHLLVFDRRLLFGQSALRYGAEWLAVFILVGLFEEFLFRGYIQFTLTRGLLGLTARFSPNHNPDHTRRTAFWIAAVFFSLLFSLTHLSNAGEDPIGIIMVFAAGILFSYALWRTGALWWGIGFHLTWDWGQSFLFGVPDSGMVTAGRLFATHAAGRTVLSGGTTGPEGSIYVLPVLLLAAVAVRLYPQREQPPVEPASLPLAMHTAPHSPIP